MKRAFPYLLWIFFLILAQMGRGTEDSTYSFHFTDSLSQIFLNQQFNNPANIPLMYNQIENVDNFWEVSL